MSDVEFEYAIRRDVRNNPIVREVDRARVAEMWRWAAVVVGLGLVLVLSAWEHFQVLQYGYLIEEMRRQRTAEDELRRHLLLDRAVLLRPERLERVATERLHLVVPGPDATIVVERVSTGEPPARGVVAAHRPF
jgi:hypothetical protein